MVSPSYSCEVSGQPISRRQLLGLGATIGLSSLAGLSGCTVTDLGLPDRPVDRARNGPTCVARASLPRFGRLASLPLVYEVNRRRSEFAIEQGFAEQLAAWLADLTELTGWDLRQLWTYGTWTDGTDRCSSWHNAGRAFDLARLRLGDGQQVSCRYDQWRTGPDRTMATAQRRYWALAASAHKHFAYVLTYLYDDRHHNHIHLDNGRSGSAMSSFSTRSPAQVQAVQGMLTHLWDSPVEITGRYDAATRGTVATVLDGLEVSGELTDQPTWMALLDASTRRGARPD